MGKDAKNIAKVSGSTLLSRVAGLVRDSATMAYMGIGAVNAAYTFAFTLPNLFRRLLGDGALTSSLIPVFSKSLKNDGREEAFAFLNKVLTRGGILMVAIVLVGMAIAACASFCADGGEENLRFVLGADFSIVLMPYLFLVCMAAVFSGALNVVGSFGVPSITPVLHNISIICGLFCGVFIFGAKDVVALAYCMSAGWLAGGLIQLGLPAYWLSRQGWRFSFDLSPSPALAELYKTFIPALLSAGVFQLNVFVSKMFALFLDNSALSTLYLSSRIMEFPLGVFSISIATVYFPKLSEFGASGDAVSHRRTYADGLVLTMGIVVPAMLGIFATSRDILTMLFEWGLFASNDVDMCLPVLLVSASGLPFFALATFATRGLYSLQDMRTPLRISCWAFAVNIVLSISLMYPFGASGLAAANVLATVLQSLMLALAVAKVIGRLGEGGEIAKIALASVAMSAAVYLARFAFAEFVSGKTLSVSVCCVLIPFGAAVYAVMLKLLRFKRFDNLGRLLRLKKLENICRRVLEKK